MSLSQLRIPVLGADRVWMRLSPLPRTGEFRPDAWRHEPLQRDGDWWRINVASLGLSDGGYEYEFVVERPGMPTRTVADPYAEEITRFSGYRSVLRVQGGQRVRLPFSWSNELPQAGGLPNNNELVIYELPMRWVDAGEDGLNRQVGLGTFDKALFEHLRPGGSVARLGINCLELLPIQDSPDTLNWGYGTRFFLAPDFDMGEPFDLKLLIKRCHQSGIRVIFDLVMNHARACPLRDLAFDWFFLSDGREEPDPNGDPRPGWGGDIFRYRAPRGDAFHARAFHFGVAEYLIREYHVDGFRLDEFKGIDNYEFVQDFRDHAHRVHSAVFPGRPFIVIAEDSWRRAPITGAAGYRGRPVVDSMWDFAFRDDVRRLVSNTLWTRWGEPSRSSRTRELISLGRFGDMSNRVTYCTSHDVEADLEQRLFTYFMDTHNAQPAMRDELDLTNLVLTQVQSTFALTLTTAGIPMSLAGEEFADLHDTDRRNWRHKMSDPVDWVRGDFVGRRELRERVTDLSRLRTGHPALHRNEVQFFGFDAGNAGFHPTFDADDGERLFAYCRTSGRPLGSPGQVIVVGNGSGNPYPEVWINWPWGFSPALTEHGGAGQLMPFVSGSAAVLPLNPFQVRVFSV